jgi:lipoprotein-anchoring transpeptidase ErfK/SrfK
VAVPRLAAALFLVSGCTVASHSSTDSSGTKAPATVPTTASTTASTPSPAKTPVVTVASGAGTGSISGDLAPADSQPGDQETGDRGTGGSGSAVSYQRPVRLVVTGGAFTSVQVSTVDGDEPLEGMTSADGTSWSSHLPPHPGSAYRMTATVKDTAGRESTRSLTFTVASVPSSQRVGFSVVPQNGSRVGIGQPIVVRFLTPIKERAAFEKVMTVTATTPAGLSVTGSWHWLGNQEVHWRPLTFWTPGTKVRLDMRIAGVKAAPNRYGRRDYVQTFTIGASQITRVDGITHRVKVYRDGKLVKDWAGGTGKKGLETYSGTYIVLGKSAEIVMDSCSARITCDKKNPEYYSEKEFWATRISASGTFLHAASWDPLLGKANVSHGCIHLRDIDARDLYDHSVIGDVVIVGRTGRGPQERIATQDPGLYDWNLTWSQWVAGSALR